MLQFFLVLLVLSGVLCAPKVTTTPSTSKQCNSTYNPCPTGSCSWSDTTKTLSCDPPAECSAKQPMAIGQQYYPGAYIEFTYTSSKITVTYHAPSIGGVQYCISQVHLFVGQNLADAQNTVGNIAPGQFPLVIDVPNLQTYTVVWDSTTFPSKAIPSCTNSNLYMVAHAHVFQCGTNDAGQTGYSGGLTGSDATGQWWKYLEFDCNCVPSGNGGGGNLNPQDINTCDKSQWVDYRLIPSGLNPNCDLNRALSMVQEYGCEIKCDGVAVCSVPMDRGIADAVEATCSTPMVSNRV